MTTCSSNNKSQDDVLEELRRRIQELENENARLKKETAATTKKSNEESHDKEKNGERSDNTNTMNNEDNVVFEHQALLPSEGLSSIHIERYSRQLLLRNGFGVQGQRKLLTSSVLVVGAGGIGSTVILYLAACGVGKLTIIDFDEVDVSNLHRQIIHKSTKVGMNKAESACQSIQDLNPTICCEPIKEPLTTSNALEIISKHDCIVDASDNPKTRYIINDACVLADKPLVSGSAIGTEGQLTVYNYTNNEGRKGPCYRCLYPKPDSSGEGCKSCSDNGVLGPVPGIIGTLQAIETLKVLTRIGNVMSEKLVMYDSLGCSFLRIKKPPKQSKCPACGPQPTIRCMEDSDNASSTARGPSCPILQKNNYGGVVINAIKLPPTLQVTCTQYNEEIVQRKIPHILLDVRVQEQFELCSLKNSINIPLENLSDNIKRLEQMSNGVKPIYCLCRRGIASAAATRLLSDVTTGETGASLGPKIHSVKNIEGGLDVWRKHVDSTFPKY